MPTRLAPSLAVTLALLAVLLAGVLTMALVSMPAHQTALPDLVRQAMSRSGVSHPVTAVVLNFRGYDTMLEIGVVLLALVGVWSMGHGTGGMTTGRHPGLVFHRAVAILLPLLILMAGYLLWIGSRAPGGAFQAGALLAGGGVLVVLTGWRPGKGHRFPVSVGAAIGFLTFVVIAAGTTLSGGTLLHYQPAWSEAWTTTLFLAIETSASVSIGISLTALCLGGLPNDWSER